MISVDGLAVEFGGTTLFSDISFVINEKDRIALMGKNGAGKSTLLKILAGARQPTRGKVSAPKDCVVAYLPQHLMTEDGRTVFDETAQAFSHLHEMEAQIEKLNKELETRTDYESDSYMALIEEVSALSEKFYSIDATNYEEDVEKALLGLGFTRSDFQRQTSDFSGGWRMRIELAKLLLQKPDVLLLDEPTNHLDIESIQWLEDFLINNGKAVIVISHDRKFVDNITTRTIEVTMGRIYDYKVNYSQYLQLRKDRREQQQKAYDEQQKFIAETKEFIERFKGTYSKTLQVQSRVKMLEKLEGEGRLVGLDIDPIESEKTVKRLRAAGFSEDTFQFRLMNFANIDKVAEEFGQFDFVLADLGVSSMQIDDPKRGFSYKTEGPLDLRLDPMHGDSAADRLLQVTQKEFEGMLIENSDEPYAAEIAASVFGRLKNGKKIETTTDLRNAVEAALVRLPKAEREEAVKKSCARTFQALRIDVNSEFEVLYSFLEKLDGILKPGGRVAILTFHSGEDRLVKKAFKELKKAGVYAEISADVIRPSAEECRLNPRARSTKMRWAVKAE